MVTVIRSLNRLFYLSLSISSTKRNFLLFKCWAEEEPWENKYICVPGKIRECFSEGGTETWKILLVKGISDRGNMLTQRHEKLWYIWGVKYEKGGDKAGPVLWP